MLGLLRIQLPHCELLMSWASAVLGLCVTGAKLRLLQPGYIQVMAPEMSGGRVCNFLGSVSPQQRFEKACQCYSSVIAQNFIQQTENSTLSRHEGGLTPKERL